MSTLSSGPQGSSARSASPASSASLASESESGARRPAGRDADGRVRDGPASGRANVHEGAAGDLAGGAGRRAGDGGAGGDSPSESSTGVGARLVRAAPRCVRAPGRADVVGRSTNLALALVAGCRAGGASASESSVGIGARTARAASRAGLPRATGMRGAAASSPSSSLSSMTITSPLGTAYAGSGARVGARGAAGSKSELSTIRRARGVRRGLDLFVGFGVDEGVESAERRGFFRGTAGTLGEGVSGAPGRVERVASTRPRLRS
jgi:hypothetical protein